MARRFPKEPKLKRRKPERLPKLKLVVVCEGKNTESAYLKDFANDYKNQLLELEVIPKGGVPMTVVDKAVERRRQLLQEANRTGNSFDKQFQVWCMFDVNDHPDIHRAKDKARSSGIGLGISNPCFELWGLLHCCDHDAPIHRHDLQRKLKKEMPGYDHNSSATFNYTWMREQYEMAKRRACWICQRRDQEGDPGGNPSTNVYEILELIIANGKK